MNPRKWLPDLPLFGAPPCVYCGGVSDTHDHAPARVFLPKKVPNGVNLMTVPACNRDYGPDETLAAAVISTVSFTDADKVANAPGGWLHRAKAGDQALARFIGDRLDADGYFQTDEAVTKVLARAAVKTALGLIFFEFGRLIPRDEFQVVAMGHSKQMHPDALVESQRLRGNRWAEVTPSGRALERQVTAAFGMAPRHATPWQTYLAGFFEYKFIRREDSTLLCGMNFHEALTMVVECPWPSQAGPLRKGKPSQRVASRNRRK